MNLNPLLEKAYLLAGHKGMAQVLTIKGFDAKI